MSESFAIPAINYQPRRSEAQLFNHKSFVREKQSRSNLTKPVGLFCNLVQNLIMERKYWPNCFVKLIYPDGEDSWRELTMVIVLVNNAFFVAISTATS